MKQSRKSDWRQAAEALASCIGTIECDCSVLASESAWAQIVYRRCERLMTLIEDKRPDLKW